MSERVSVTQAAKQEATLESSLNNQRLFIHFRVVGSAKQVVYRAVEVVSNFN